MPFDALTNADNFRILGSLTVVDDPNGNSGNANIKGTHTVSGSLIAGSALQVAGSALLNGCNCLEHPVPVSHRRSR